jgi:UDP-N-acetylglucosamine acyltransferase
MIHPSAIVDPKAQIAESAEIGPYCVIGPEVTIGERTRLLAHVFMDGRLTIGDDNMFFPYSTIGVGSQDLKYHGEPSETRIGHRNQIREFVTIHRGTEGGGMLTSVGHHTVLGHAATIGGHVTIGDWAIVSASSGVHQFCRIGRHAFVGGYSVITQDVLPYSNTVTAREAKVFGENSTGLKRRGFSAESIDALHKAFRLLSHSNLNTTQLIGDIRTAERGFIK